MIWISNVRLPPIPAVKSLASTFDPLRTSSFGEMQLQVSRANPKPTRVTMLFYAAFAVSYAQGRYTSPDFYRWVAGEFFQVGLVLFTLAAFLVLTLGAFIQSLRARGLPWWHGTAAIGAIVAAEVIWRFGVNNLPGHGFKEVAIVIDMAKPIVALLGLAAIIAEGKARSGGRSPKEAHSATA